MGFYLNMRKYINNKKSAIYIKDLNKTVYPMQIIKIEDEGMTNDLYQAHQLGFLDLITDNDPADLQEHYAFNFI